MKINRWFEQLKRNKKLKSGITVKKRSRSNTSPKKMALQQQQHPQQHQQQSSFEGDSVTVVNLQADADTTSTINGTTRYD